MTKGSLKCSSKGCGTFIPKTSILADAANYCCSRCGPGYWFCPSCALGCQHQFWKGQRKRISVEDIQNGGPKKRSTRVEPVLAIGDVGDVGDVVAPRTVSDLETNVFWALCAMLGDDLHRLDGADNPIARNSDMASAICPTCTTRVLVAGWLTAPNQLVCYACGTRSGEGVLARLLLQHQLPAFSAFLQKFSGLSVAVRPITLGSSDARPSSEVGYNVDGATCLSDVVLLTEMAFPPVDVLITAFNELVTKDRTRSRNAATVGRKLLDKIRSGPGPVYFKYNLEHHDQQSAFFRLVKALRQHEYGSAGEEMAGIHCIGTSTLVLLGNGLAGTPWHCDRLRACNVGFRLEGEDSDSKTGLPTPIALWILFPSKAVSSVDGALKAELGREEGLRSSKLLTLSEGEKLQVAVGVDADGHFLVHLKLQQAGELIHVPPGWFHQVTNLVDCVKLSWDVLRPSELTQYIQVWKDVISRQDVDVAADSSGVFALLERISCRT